MVFFVRARYYFSYAESLLKEVQSGTRPLTPTLALDIFSLGLKAIYALEVAKPEEQKPSLEELVQRVSTSVSPGLKRLLFELKEELKGLSSEDIAQKQAIILEKLSEYLILLREELKPIL